MIRRAWIAGVFFVLGVTVGCATTAPSIQGPVPTRLCEAAGAGDLEAIDRLIGEGASVSETDTAGNTPLHYAYYLGQEQAAERLLVHGADTNLRNVDGLTAADLREVARIEGLLTTAAALLDRQGEWIDAQNARPIYEELKQDDPTLVTKAIVSRVAMNEDRLRVLFLAVKLGISGSEEPLINLLESYGDVSMAEDYLNSGSATLYDGAKRWGNKRGYDIRTGSGSHRVFWETF
ncbi:MAG TPA: ankyrin repeat domain-containing protein [Candidatus Hydrogenedentes bacterium]|nr:ankyrin repeat domain-containing protein [Candidatus Hydrogenedentota bacterium]HPG66287.1 ankyrin repeat domain-containing protein [Candidatus Hydrogenedentota bacterium]